MFIVMLVGGNEAGRFFAELKQLHDEVIFMPDDEEFYDDVDLFVCFSGDLSPRIRPPRPIMTWCGNDLDTLDRVYKRLGLPDTTNVDIK